MNTDRDIESALRNELAGVAGAVRPELGLAERLIANATSGTHTVVPLRRSRRLAAPLLAAAVCIVLAVGIVVANQFSAGRRAPAVAPAVTTGLTTSGLSTEASSTAAPSFSATTNATAGSSAWGGVSGNGGLPATTNPARDDWLRVLPAASGAPEGFSGVYARFLDSKTGFVVGDARCADRDRNRCPALIRTDDGGATWRALSIPQGLRSARVDSGCGNGAGGVIDPCVDDITFADVDHGYLTGPELAYATSDGGRSWQSVPMSGGAFDYSFVGDRVLRVLATSKPDPDVGGFGTYQLQSAPVGSTDFRAIWDAHFPGGAAFRIYQAGPVTYLVADTPEGMTKIFRTRDARAWEPVAAGPCNGFLGYLGLLPAGDGAVFADCASDTGSELHLMTADGSEWIRVPSPRIDGGWRGQIVSASSADRLALLVQGDSIGDKESWVGTDDGGKTWNEPRTVGAVFPTANLTDRLSTVSGGVFVVADLGADLVSSLDGGKTWQQRALG